MKKFSSLVAVSGCLLLSLLVGCASQSNTTDTSHDDQFFGQHVDFKPATNGSGEVYRSGALSPEKLAQYDSFIVDPVMIWYSDKSDYQGIFPDELKAISDYTRAAIEKDLGANFKIVTTPGPKTLRVRVAITNMLRRKPANPLDFIPIGAVVYGVKEAAGANEPTRKKVDKGYSYIIYATIEGGIYDSDSGALLGAYKDTAKTERGDSKEAINQEKGATWGQVKSAINSWAAELAEKINAAHKKAEAS